MAVSTSKGDFPRLGEGGSEVIEVAQHLVDEELQIAERLERKSREQWALVAFLTPISIGLALTSALKGDFDPTWIIVIGAVGLFVVGLLVASIAASSAMADTQVVDSLNLDRLRGYVTDLDRQKNSDQ